MTAKARDLNGDVVFSNQLYQRDMALRGYSVKSGLAPTGGGTTTMEVDIAEGVAWVNGVEVPFAGDSIAISAADANYPRKDLVSIDSTGTLQVTEGTPGAADPSGDSGAQTFTPVPPALPADETLICEVWVAAAAVGIVDANITDRRLITTTAFGAFDYGMSFEGTVTSVDLPKFLCSNLTGYGDNYFKGYWAYVVWDADGAGAAPQTEKKIITAYVSATGEFTVGAYTVAIGVADKVLIMHPAIMGDVIVEVGEMSDTATADSLSDIATTSVHAKLGRLLLRFSADAFAATINGASKTDVESMFAGLASYFVAAGAAFSTSIGGSARTAIDTALAALDAEIYTAGHTLKTPNTKIGDIARTIDLIIGSRYDSSGDIGTDLSGLITKLAKPDTDATTDATVAEAIGIKADTAQTTVGTTRSIMAYVKGLVDAGIAAAGTVNDAGASATDFITDLAEASDDHYNGALLMFISGNLKGQSRYIEDYTGLTKSCNFDAITANTGFTEAPANSDKFVILPAEGALTLCLLMQTYNGVAAIPLTDPDPAGTAAGIIDTTDKLNLLLAATDGAASTLAAANVADGSIIAKLASKTANGAAPENFDCTTDSLEAIADAIQAVDSTTRKRQAGVLQQLSVNKTSNADAGDVTLATCNTQKCLIHKIIARSNGATTANLTNIEVFGATGKRQTYIDATQGAQANLAADGNSIGSEVGGQLNTAETIVATYTGIAATATDITYYIIYSAVADGGYLA